MLPHLVSRFDCGSGMALIRTPNTVERGSWNTVRIDRRDWNGWIRLNNGTKTHGRSKVRYCCLPSSAAIVTASGSKAREDENVLKPANARKQGHHHNRDQAARRADILCATSGCRFGEMEKPARHHNTANWKRANLKSNSNSFVEVIVIFIECIFDTQSACNYSIPEIFIVIPNKGLPLGSKDT